MKNYPITSNSAAEVKESKVNDELCPVAHCRANLRVWAEMGLGEHKHFPGEGKYVLHKEKLI